MSLKERFPFLWRVGLPHALGGSYLVGTVLLHAVLRQ